jgi:hypothetical protein
MKENEHIRIHNHPTMERNLSVPSDHVIIDAALYMEIVRRFGFCLPDEENIIINSNTPIKGEY